MTYHHFVGNTLSRSEKIQAWVVEEILNSRIPQERRESSVIWELKHSSGTIQLARILAQKRGVNPELAEVAAALHEIHVIREGTYEEHAKRGALIARERLDESGEFSESEMDAICGAIGNHSDKHIYSGIPLVELIKDADSLDCFLYAEDIYEYKPAEVLPHYYSRLAKIREELGMPPLGHRKAMPKQGEAGK